MNIYNVIMAGGGGTRFWPLSRQEVPKQLINLSGEDALINETINRIDSLASKENLFIVTNEKQIDALHKESLFTIYPTKEHLATVNIEEEKPFTNQQNIDL